MLRWVGLACEEYPDVSSIMFRNVQRLKMCDRVAGTSPQIFVIHAIISVSTNASFQNAVTCYHEPCLKPTFILEKMSAVVP